MATKKNEDFCPKCYFDGKGDVAIIYNLGSTQPLKCRNEHVFDDREELSSLTRAMLDQKKTLQPKTEAPPPSNELLPDVDLNNALGNSTNPLPTDGVKGMNVPPVDIVRLTSLLGTFRDSSSLFGSIFALKQELSDTQELLKRATAAKAVSGIGSGPTAGPRVIGGDMAIQLVIPERHVAALKDISSANGMDVTRYMNAKVEDGLDSMWYY